MTSDLCITFALCTTLQWLVRRGVEALYTGEVQRWEIVCVKFCRVGVAGRPVRKPKQMNYSIADKKRSRGRQNILSDMSLFITGMK